MVRTKKRAKTLDPVGAPQPPVLSGGLLFKLAFQLTCHAVRARHAGHAGHAGYANVR